MAAVGFSERELMMANAPYAVARYAFADHGKAEVMGETDGFVKLMVSAETCEILGAAAVGPDAGELIHEIAAAMYFRATAHDLLRIPHYHPTLSEIWTYPAEELVTPGLRGRGEEKFQVSSFRVSRGEKWGGLRKHR